MTRILRVFPRRTSFTPTDAMAFVGEPPLMRPQADEVHVSVTFTWDRERGEHLAAAWRQYYPVVRLGGPAYGSPAGAFTPGMYVRESVTFTSRGCNHSCPWCLVPTHEGHLSIPGPIPPGWIVQDNNLLQCPREHILRVADMLQAQHRAITFSGGLETRLIDDWVVANLLWETDIKAVFLACDTVGALRPLLTAVARLSFLRRDQLRCYVLIGRETMPEAKTRLRAVWDAGCLPFAQLYQPPDEWIQYSPEWRALARTWSRPAATKALMRDRNAHQNERN